MLSSLFERTSGDGGDGLDPVVFGMGLGDSGAGNGLIEKFRCKTIDKRGILQFVPQDIFRHHSSSDDGIGSQSTCRRFSGYKILIFNYITR
jgi:hypothetical protein